MKHKLLGGIVATVTLCMTGVAQAVPMYFDFTGNITSYTLPALDGVEPGGAVSGSLTLESDRLLSSGPPASGIQYTFLDWNPTGLSEPLGTLSFGGREVSIPQFTQNYAYVNFVDGCKPLCNTGWAENFSINAAAQDLVTVGYTGLYHSSYISVRSVSETALPDFPYWQMFDSFDGAAMTPLDAVTLPLYHLTGSYLENTLDCVNGECTEVSSGFFNFDVTSLTRGVGSRSVPEPGTLGLMFVALAGGFMLRRRKASPQRLAI